LIVVVLTLFAGAVAKQVDDRAVVNKLMRDLDRTELGIRRGAAMQLSGRKSLPASLAPVLFRHALVAGDQSISCCLWRALGATGPQSVQYFAQALETKPDDPGERGCIVTGLVPLAASSLQAVQLLKEIAAGNEENPATEAVTGLWKAGTASSAALGDLLSNPDPTLRTLTLRGLRYSSAKIPPDLVARMKDLLTDSDARVRAGAAASLVMQQTHLPEAREVLFEALKSRVEWVFEYWVIDALQELGPEAAAAVPDLGRILLESGTGGSQSVAARALGRIATPEAIGLLSQGLRLEERLYRRECILALGEAGRKMPEKAIPILMQACGDESGGIRMAASEALAVVGDPAIPSLLPALKDKDPYVRESAAHALQEIGSSRSEVVDALLDAAVDPFPMVATWASSALFKLKNQAVVDELLKRQKLATDRKLKDPTAAGQRALLSEDELRRNLPPTEEFKYAAELKTFERFQMTPPGALAVSIHKGKDRPEILRIWTPEAGSFRMLKEMEIEPGIGWFEQPHQFRHSGEVFLHVRKRYDGSGGLFEDFVWTVSSGRLMEVEIERPFALALEPGDDFTHGKIEFADNVASFEFAVYLKGDPNCCPSGGRIVGTLKFVKEAPDKWVVKLDSHRRLPPKDN